MKSTNIENIVIFRSNGTYGYTVMYKSGTRRTTATGTKLVLPKRFNDFMINSPYAIQHESQFTDYYEDIYYSRDIRA